MNHYTELLQRLANLRMRNLVAFFIILSLGIGNPISSLFAATNNDAVIADKNSQINQLNQEISKLQQELSGVQQEKQSLSQTLREISTNQKKISTTIQKTGAEIEKTGALLDTINSQILTHEQRIQIGKAAIAKSLRALYEYQDTTLFELLLSNQPLSEKWENIDNLLALQKATGDELDMLLLTKEQLAQKLAEEALNKQEMEELLQQKRIEGQSLSVVESEKAKLLKETQNKESEYQKIINEKLAKKKQFEQELFDYESQLKYTFKPGQLPAEGSAALAWPIANPYITQFFGATPSSTRLYASGQHSGVDFRAAVGTPILASANGVVAGVGDTDLACPRASFGKWIFIKHDNNLAMVYAHMSQISVKTGDRVVQGQTIGLSGNTGHSTAPHLHISVFPADAVSIQNRPSKACPGKVFVMPIAATESYLNPIKYLPVFTPAMVKPGAY